MTVLVTGGAGFIGSNFVLDWLAQHDEAVVNLDALTYAGNLQNLASLQGESAPEGDGLLVVTADALTVTPLGRTFVRNLCMPFDRYLQARLGGKTPVFSRTV